MRKITVCGILQVGGLQYFLVHPKPIEPDSWLKPDQQMFLVTYPGEQRTEKLEMDGLIKDVKIYTRPFHVIVNVINAVIVLDRLWEIIVDEMEEEE